MKLPKFNWSQTIFGYNSALGHFTASIAVLLFLPLLRRFTNIEDTTLAVAGLVSKIAGLLLLALAAYTWQVFLGKWVIICNIKSDIDCKQAVPFLSQPVKIILMLIIKFEKSSTYFW